MKTEHEAELKMQNEGEACYALDVVIGDYIIVPQMPFIEEVVTIRYQFGTKKVVLITQSQVQIWPGMRKVYRIPKQGAKKATVYEMFPADIPIAKPASLYKHKVTNR